MCLMAETVPGRLYKRRSDHMDALLKGENQPLSSKQRERGSA
jgi:hypothetical protein